MLQTRINIYEKHKINILTSRNLADKIINNVEKNKSNRITLDFKGVDACSRSFFDQLNARVVSSNKSIKFANLNTDLARMANLIKQA